MPQDEPVSSVTSTQPESGEESHQEQDKGRLHFLIPNLTSHSILSSCLFSFLPPALKTFFLPSCWTSLPASLLPSAHIDPKLKCFLCFFILWHVFNDASLATLQTRCLFQVLFRFILPSVIFYAFPSTPSLPSFVHFRNTRKKSWFLCTDPVPAGEPQAAAYWQPTNGSQMARAEAWKPFSSLAISEKAWKKGETEAVSAYAG